MSILLLMWWALVDMLYVGKLTQIENKKYIYLKILSRKTQMNTDSVVSCVLSWSLNWSPIVPGAGLLPQMQNQVWDVLFNREGPLYTCPLSIFSAWAHFCGTLLTRDVTAFVCSYLLLWKTMVFLLCNIPDFRLCVHVVLCNCICI